MVTGVPVVVTEAEVIVVATVDSTLMAKEATDRSVGKPCLGNAKTSPTPLLDSGSPPRHPPMDLVGGWWLGVWRPAGGG